MSLSVGKYFAKAIKDNTALYTLIGGRLFPVARSTEDEALDKIPYIIMRPVKVENEMTTKDEAESDYDSATIELDCVASTYDALVTLTESVRTVIRTAFETGLDVSSWPFILTSYSFSADDVSYDETKPCYWQTLRYVCETEKR